MPCAMIFVQVASIALVGLLPLAARAERPSQMSQLLQGRGQVVEVAAHGHLLDKGKRDVAKETHNDHVHGSFNKTPCAPSPVPPPPGTQPTEVDNAEEPSGAACSVNPGCKKLGLAGDCCPNSAGMMLGCCAKQEDHSEEPAPTSGTDSEEQTPAPAPAPPPASGEGFQFTVAKFKPDFICNRIADAKGRATARINRFTSDGVGILGLIEAMWPMRAPPGYWFVGAQCRNPSQDFSDPVVIMFKASEFDYVRGIGQSAKVPWNQLPYVGGGGMQAGMRSGVEGYKSAAACTASNTNWHVGVRAYGGALVKHKASGQEVCVVVGTFPHSIRDVKQDWYNDAIMRAGCKGKPIVFMFDQNYNGHHWDFDFKREWGWGHDPGADAPCDGRNRVGCTCCLQEGQDPDTKSLKFDRIAAFGPKDWGKQAVRVDNFHVEQEWVCKAKGEHKITTGTIVVKHR